MGSDKGCTAEQGAVNLGPIAIIIPAFNEAATIAGVVEQCRVQVECLSPRGRVFVVDDGSTDETVALARGAGAEVVSHGSNRGVGRAFQTGLERALRCGAEVLVNIDADGQFDPAAIPLLIEPITSGRADFATASRFKDPALAPKMPRVKRAGNAAMSRLISAIARQKLADVSCGFRAYNREAALQLNLWGSFTYTQESILDLAVKGLRIEEVPMQIEGVRAHGESRVASNLWRYGSRTLQIILHSYRDYWPLHFFGWISLPCFLLGGGLVGFLFVHRVVAGAFSPHIWAGFSGAGLFALGMLILITGIVGETLKRIRLNQEALLYYHRKAEYGPEGIRDSGFDSASSDS